MFLGYNYGIMKKSWPVLVLATILIAIIGVSCYTDPSNETKQNGAGSSTLLPTIAYQQAADSGQNTKTTPRSPVWRMLIAWPAGVETLALVLTLIFIAWQTLLTRQAIASSDAASKAELRAYVGVLINSALYQEREKDIKFSGIPALTNTGKTPAHKVRYRINAAILLEPLDRNYAFPPGQNEIGEYVLGVNSQMIMSTDVADYCDTQDADDILHSRGNRALYCWGTISYTDAFGDDHETNFCHRLYFDPDLNNPGKWKVNGHYLAGRNNAT